MKIRPLIKTLAVVLMKTLVVLLAAFIVGFATPVLAVELDFNNSSGQPDQAGGMVFSRVGNENGTDFDLVIKALGTFKTGSRNLNGTINPGVSADGNINFHRSNSSRFSFSFVETATKKPFTVSEFRLGFFDIDGSGNSVDGRDQVILYSPAKYTLSKNTRIVPQQLPDNDGNGLPDGIRFSPSIGSPNNIVNPKNTGNLAPTQERSAVYFDFENTSDFVLGLGVISGTPTNERNISFDDDLVFDQELPLIVEPFNPEPEPVPAPAPEPEVCDPNKPISAKTISFETAPAGATPTDNKALSSSYNDGGTVVTFGFDTNHDLNIDANAVFESRKDGTGSVGSYTSRGIADLDRTSTGEGGDWLLRAPTNLNVFNNVSGKTQADFLVVYSGTPVQSASGQLWDIDAGEQYKIEALDANGNLIDSIFTPGNIPGGEVAGTFDAKPFNFAFSDTGKDISFIRIVGVKRIGGGGFAFDNFNATSSSLCEPEPPVVVEPEPEPVTPEPPVVVEPPEPPVVVEPPEPPVVVEPPEPPVVVEPPEPPVVVEPEPEPPVVVEPEPEPEVCDPNEPIPGAFSSIRIGDIDGFGFSDGKDLTAANGKSVNIDGNGVLTTGDYLPDFNQDGKFSNRDGGDPFDNRSKAEADGHFLGGDGYEDMGSTGSDYTDVFLGKAFTKLKSDYSFPDGDPKTLPNQPGFQFRFKVAKEKLPEGTPVFLNTMLGDYDVKPTQVIITKANGKSVTKELKVSEKGKTDGSIQASFIKLDFNQVFSDGDANGEKGYWVGYLDVDFDAPNEPATSFDFSEIGTNKILLKPCP